MDMIGKDRKVNSSQQIHTLFTKAIKGGKAGLSRYHIKNNSVSSNFDTT